MHANIYIDIYCVVGQSLNLPQVLVISFLNILEFFWENIKAVDKRCLEMMDTNQEGDDDDDISTKDGHLESTLQQKQEYDFLSDMNHELKKDSLVNDGIEMKYVSMKDFIDILHKSSNEPLEVKCERGCCNNGIDYSEWGIKELGIGKDDMNG